MRVGQPLMWNRSCVRWSSDWTPKALTYVLFRQVYVSLSGRSIIVVVFPHVKRTSAISSICSRFLLSRVGLL
jgi:hypothetical protein